MPEKFESGKFVEKREPGRVLEFFEYEGKKAEIRYAKPEDCQGIIEAIKARWKERSESEDVPDNIREDYKKKLMECEVKGFSGSEPEVMEKSFFNSSLPFFIVADVEGKVAGYVEMGDRPGFESAIWVSTMSVLPEYQGKKIENEKKGFAHKLLEHGIAQARQESASKDKTKVALYTHTWTPRAVKFWEKEGFNKEESTAEEEVALAAWPDPYRIKMAKYLEEDK